jgi:hypothetical protein
MRERLPFDDDDYTLADRDFDEFIRRGMEEVEWERNQRAEE